MITDAVLLSVKVAGLYNLKMEAAAIIHKVARDLMVQKHSLKEFGFEYPVYIDIARKLIEE